MKKREAYQAGRTALPNKLYPAIQMTNGCNKQCKACLRSANSSVAKIEYDVFEKYLCDLRNLSESYSLAYQFVTGGEPTIWKSQGKDIVDVLASLFKLNLITTISMPSNGRVFENIDFAREFFKRLSSQIDTKMIVGISIADYQENLSESGYIAMNNLIRLSREPGIKIFPVILVTLSVDDDTDKRLRKIYPNVFQRVTPLAPLGDASDMKDMAPSLSLSGNNKDPLGSFYPYYKKDVMKKLKVSGREFDRMPNAAIIDRLSLYAHCGMSPFIDDKWHYCLPFKENPSFDLCGIGDMREKTIPDFLNNADFINCIRTRGILTAVDDHKKDLRSEALQKLEEMYSPSSKVSIAYRGCMVCRAMHDIGVIGELIDIGKS
jgi:uncharacterized Fe-S cluster-containing radical SAM superfamily protein